MKTECQQTTTVSEPSNNNTLPNKKRPTSRLQQDDDDWLLDIPKRRPKIVTNSERSTTSESSVNMCTQNETKALTENSSLQYRKLTALKRESEKKKQQQQIQVNIFI